MLVTENGLNDSVCDCSIQLVDYNLFRHDRALDRGDVNLMFAKSSLVPSITPNGFESLEKNSK